jgi:hypothetical protein
MLPPEYRTPRIEMLERVVAKTAPEDFFKFPVLTPHDHQLIGMYIQLYNYIDLNLRRSFEAFGQGKLLKGSSEKSYPRIHSSALAGAVQDVVKEMNASVEDIPDSIGKLVEIERRREVRNLIGHWASRRIPNEDAIVLMTKNEGDAKQISGEFVGGGRVKTAVMDLPDLRGLLEHMVPFETWLAAKTSEWRKRYVGD